jgi:pimeloyl-ACP methyl ester carboxylesterase
LCHGNAGSIENRIDLARQFHEWGWSTLSFDYRGFGASTGRPSVEGVALDADAAAIQSAEPSAAAHGAVLTSPLKQRDGAGRVGLDSAPTLLEHETETGAAVADTGVARPLEQRRGARLVAQYMLSLLELDRELVASGLFALVTCVAQPLGLPVPGMAGDGEKGGEEHHEPTLGNPWSHQLDCGEGTGWWARQAIAAGTKQPRGSFDLDAKRGIL